MKTTLEIIEPFDPCWYGRVFAEAHPDPREALAAALACLREDGADAWEAHFVRWACVQILKHRPWDGRAVPGLFEHTETCARHLIAWLDAGGADDEKGGA